MIALTESNTVLKFAAPIAWRSERRIAQKLHGFAATELGSSLDMLRAAELATDPKHRRLFLRHALDESRHAHRFQSLALRIDPGSRARNHERAHALPQDLYRRLGETRFLAFVHLSESRAAGQFEALRRHFSRSSRPHSHALAALFTELVREERRHVAYSRHLLEQRFPEVVRAREVRRALSRERRALAWGAWKRAGFRLGDGAIWLLMALLFVTVLPAFALVARLTRRPTPGWAPVAPTISAAPDSAPRSLARAAARRAA